MTKSLPLARTREAESSEQERVSRPAPSSAKPKPEDEPPHPVLVLARKHLKRWDLERVCSGLQSWIQTTGSTKRIWLILPDAEGNSTFEEI